MRQVIAKRLRKLSYEFAAEWLKGFVTPEEAEKIDADSVKRFEQSQEKYVRGQDGAMKVSPYSSRHFYRRLKKAYMKKERPDFTITLEELG